jgi:Carboxypeptidase regulatory-like domain
MLVVLLLIVLPLFQQGGIIKGKVKERGGKPVEAVLVVAVNAADASKKHETSSDSKGDFELKNLPAGDYLLSFEKKGFDTFKSRQVPVAAGETVKLRSQVELVRERPPYAIIRGAVFTEEGFTLANALVKIEKITEGKRFKSEAVSQEAGEFSFRLTVEKATYRVTATAKGFEPASKDVEIEGDDVRQIAISLKKVAGGQ